MRLVGAASVTFIQFQRKLLLRSEEVKILLDAGADAKAGKLRPGSFSPLGSWALALGPFLPVEERRPHGLRHVASRWCDRPASTSGHSRDWGLPRPLRA